MGRPLQDRGLIAWRPRRPGYFIAGLLLLAAAAAMFCLAVQDTLFGQFSKDWPTTSGKVVVSEHGSEAVRVRYTYQVDNIEYTADRVKFDHTCGDSGAPDRYPVGAEVRVYYRSSDPSTAVLEPGYGEGVGIAVLFGVVLVGLGLLVLSAARPRDPLPTLETHA
jgi:hypothetical protein